MSHPTESRWAQSYQAMFFFSWKAKTVMRFFWFSLMFKLIFIDFSANSSEKDVISWTFIELLHAEKLMLSLRRHKEMSENLLPHRLWLSWAWAQELVHWQWLETQKTTCVFDRADTSFLLADNISGKQQGMQSIPGTSTALAGGFEDKLLSCKRRQGKKDCMTSLWVHWD